MTERLDLGPAAQRMAALIRTHRRRSARRADAVPRLLARRPRRPRRWVRHGVHGRRDQGHRRRGPGGGSGDASRLVDDWRSRIPRDLAALAAAWRDPEAWTGMTRAGGIDLPGEIAGVVALDELVVHGWDVARAPVDSRTTSTNRRSRRCTGSSSSSPHRARIAAGSSVRSSRCRTMRRSSTGPSASLVATRIGSPG